jgi:hypothetical protein
MKIFMIIAITLVASATLADECVTSAAGRKVCRPTAPAPTTQPVTGKVTTETNNGAKAAYNPNTGTAATSQKYANGATSARTNTGTSAAYNPNTGKAAVQQTNANGVKTTQTTSGGRAKTKNGAGAAETANGTKCYKTANKEGCKP